MEVQRKIVTKCDPLFSEKLLTLTAVYNQAIDIWMGTCTAFVFAALVEFTFVNHTWRTKGRLPGIPTGLENRDYVNTSQSNGNGDQNKNLLNLEEVSTSPLSPSVPHMRPRRETPTWRTGSPDSSSPLRGRTSSQERG